VIYPYIAGAPKGLLPFVKPLYESGCRFAYERYLAEQPTEEEALRYIERNLRDDFLQFKESIPDFENRIIFVLGVFSGPPETLNTNPAASYKVYMDMQFHLLATDPALKGLYGVEEYKVAYADEEYLRWAVKLYRHYCIEGSTQRLTNDPYELKHVRNPDFEDGLKDWQVSPAGPDNVDVKKMEGYGRLQGRFSQKGDVFLWTKRSALKPNRISQEIRNLQPGRTYSLKMFAGDSLALTNEQKLAVSIEIDNVEMIPENCFQAVIQSDTRIPKYGDKATFFNWFRVVFRAKASTARLTISDWLSANEPGGLEAQELIYNFVEVEPFFM
jgi:hypothetical protein